VGTELLEALRAADPLAPPVLEAFDRIVAQSDGLPDFYEHSMRVGGGESPYRFTYYFDVHRRGAAVAREAGARFVRLGAELGLAVPSSLREFVQSAAPAGDEVLQVVLGIEAPRDGSDPRGKYYLVFRGNPERCVRDLLGALGLEPAVGTRPEKVYIVGVDVTAGGVDDVKLYFRLESRQVPNLIENIRDVADLLAASRDIVFQQCIRRPERRQMYLHARSTALLSEWLAWRGFEGALDRARSINAHLHGSRIEPWILSLAYDRRRLVVRAGTVYFHLARAVGG